VLKSPLPGARPTRITLFGLKGVESKRIPLTAPNTITMITKEVRRFTLELTLLPP